MLGYNQSAFDCPFASLETVPTSRYFSHVPCLEIRRTSESSGVRINEGSECERSECEQLPRTLQTARELSRQKDSKKKCHNIKHAV